MTTLPAPDPSDAPVPAEGTAADGGPALTVGLVIDDSLDRPDGVQQYVLTLGAWLAARGHDVHYVTASSERTDLANLHVVGRTVAVRFNGNTLGTPRPVPRAAAAALVDEVGFDVLHVQMPYSPLLAGRLVSAAAPATAVVGTFHIYPASWLVSAGARVLGAAERRRLRRFDEVLAVSEAAQEFARSSFGIATRVVGNPVDLARLTPDAGAALVPQTGEPHLVFLGRLVERKGPRELVRALAALHDDSPACPWRATVAGRGPLLETLRADVERAGIADRVSFPGFVAEEDKAALLASADVVALPSTGGESFGISVVEALAAARGVVLAGDNPGYRTVMRGLETQLVDPRDTAAFAGTLAHWLSDLEDDVTRAETVAAQRAAAARFDVSVIGAQVEATYRAAVARRREAAAELATPAAPAAPDGPQA